MKERLTDSAIAKLAKNHVPTTGSIVIWDSRLSGFGLRITAGGVSSFVLNYRTVGRERRYTIGRWPVWKAEAAFNEAGKLRIEIDGGGDPLEQRKADEIVDAHRERTLAEMVKELYLGSYAPGHKREKSVRDDKGMLYGVILPRLGSMPLSEIHTTHIEKLRNDLKATPYRANRVLSLLSKIFNLVIADDEEKARKYTGEEPIKWITINPASAKRVKRYKERQRKKYLSVEQCTALKKALDDYPSQDVANIVKLQLLTGSRVGEVLSAEWSHFDLKKGVWNKPAELVKQDEDETLELSGAAVDLLKQMPRAKKTVLREGKSIEIENPFLFPAKSDKRRGSHRGYIKWAWTQICKTAGLAEEYRVKGKKGKELKRWRPLYRTHDLRHTFASLLASAGTSLYTIGNIVGHRNTKTTQRYAHLAENVQKQAADQFAEIIGW